MNQKINILFITNIATHYRINLFEILGKIYSVLFIFFSEGKDWYWEKQNNIIPGNFKSINLFGLRITKRTRITPSLIWYTFFGSYDVMVKCINGKFALPVSFIAAKLRKKPFILWTGIWSQPKSFLHQITFVLVKIIYRYSDAIVVYGEHIKRYLIELGIPEEKIFIAWNTIDNNKFNTECSEIEKAELKKQLKLGDNAVIMYVGRLEEVKGLSYLIDAYLLISKRINCSLVLIGNGSLQDTIAKRIEELKDKKIIILPYVKNEILFKYYAITNVFVLPSITTSMFKEPWGLVINEAMNQGCPVVATDAVGAAVGGLLADGETGYIVPERDVLALSTAVEKILTRPELADKMQGNARNKIKTWTYEKQAQGFLDAIEYVKKKK